MLFAQGCIFRIYFSYIQTHPKTHVYIWFNLFQGSNCMFYHHFLFSCDLFNTESYGCIKTKRKWAQSIERFHLFIPHFCFGFIGIERKRKTQQLQPQSQCALEPCIWSIQNIHTDVCIYLWLYCCFHFSLPTGNPSKSRESTANTMKHNIFNMAARKISAILSADWYTTFSLAAQSECDFNSFEFGNQIIFDFFIDRIFTFISKLM